MRPLVESGRASQLNYVISPLELVLRAPAGSTGVKASHLLIKLHSYDGSGSVDTFLMRSVDTFLMKFQCMASYLRWDEEDMFHHLCASLEGAAGQVLWGIGS